MVKKFNSEKELMLYCKEITEQRVNDYKDYITGIEGNGASVKVEALFWQGGRCLKYIPSDRMFVFMICVSIFPAQYSKNSAEKFYICQHYYSRVGIIKNNSCGYVITANEQEDKGLTIFFKRYDKLLFEGSANDVLMSKISITLLNAVIPHRLGSSFDISYRGVTLHIIWIFILLVLVFVFRIKTPTGYHPSLKYR